MGHPTSLPSLISRREWDTVGQDFGVNQRIVYVQRGAGEGSAWVQPRKRLFWNIPNLFYVSGLTDGGQGCWEKTNSAEASQVYEPYEPRQVAVGSDWLAGQPIPLGGWWSPLNGWKSLFLSVALCVETLKPVPLVHPEGPLSYLTPLGEAWINAWVEMRMHTNARGLWLLVPGFWNIITGEFLAFLVLPVWLGMAVAGEMGAWLGRVVEFGMIIAGLYSRFLAAKK